MLFCLVFLWCSLPDARFKHSLSEQQYKYSFARKVQIQRVIISMIYRLSDLLFHDSPRV